MKSWTTLACAAVGALGAVTSQAHAEIFSYTNFDTTPDVTWLGLANPVGGAARLTSGSSTTGAGALWHNAPVTIAGGFETSFTLRLSSGGGSVDTLGQAGGDGMAFVIQGMGTTALGGAGGYLGYAGLTNSLAVEIDTWYNPGSFGDISSNSVAFHSRGVLANSSRFGEGGLVQAALPGDMIDNVERTFRLVYAQGQLALFVDNEVTPVITTSINLEQSLGLSNGLAYVGFTGGTFAANADQDVVSWSYTSVPAPGVMALAGMASLVLARRRSNARR